MPPFMDATSNQKPFLRRSLRAAADCCPPMLDAFRRLRAWRLRDPLCQTAYQHLFERGRLTLPEIAAESLSPSAQSVILPSGYPLFAGEDAPLSDLLFLLNLAKGRQVRRILEVGTYRARTTLALHLNCPEAKVVSYDIQQLDSEFRAQLAGQPQVDLRLGSFAAAATTLRSEAPYDFIFVDGSHRVEDVVADSELAIGILAPQGVAVWHDYRYNGFATRELEVPEGLDRLRQKHAFYAVEGTTCAVHVRDGSWQPPLLTKSSR